MIADLKAGFAGADREDEGVVALFFCWYRRGRDGHSSRAHGCGAFNAGVRRQIDFIRARAELRLWRVRIIFDEVVFNYVEALLVGFNADDVGLSGDTFDLW